MGFTLKFNWVLQIEPPEVLTTKSSYLFEKAGCRVFPLDTPIDLIDLERNAIAKIKISSFSNDGAITTGEYLIVKIYADVEKTVLSNYWMENQ